MDSVVDAVVVAHVVGAAASAVVSHLATTATNPDTLPVNAPNQEPKPVTTVAKMDTFLANVTQPTAVEPVAVVATATEVVTATAAANLDTSPVIAQRVDPAVTVETDASAMLVADLVTFLVIATKAQTGEEKKMPMNPDTKSLTMSRPSSRYGVFSSWAKKFGTT